MVAVVSLHAGVDAGAITKLLREEGAGGVVQQERCITGVSDSFGLILPRFKQRFIFLTQSTGKFSEGCGTNVKMGVKEMKW